jgi:DNA topoisomerase-6 subunit A
VGPVVFGDDGDRVDCTRLGKGGYSVPSIVEPEYIQITKCTADFVLLVEKGTQWNRLSEDKFWRRYNCILLTGNGQPPRGVRRLARRLNEEYSLPVYVLVDNDPWGYYIYSVVKQGSINLAFESERMAIPKAKFIGFSSADPDRYGLPRNVGIKLNDKDIGRAKELLKYRWFQKKPWQEEIRRMLASGLKYELDALANKDFRYLTKTYLPRKLKEEDWLDWCVESADCANSAISAGRDPASANSRWRRFSPCTRLSCIHAFRRPRNSIDGCDADG